jgi:hypothetical protein
MKAKRKPAPYHQFPAHCCYFCGSDEHATQHCDLEFCFNCLNPIDYEFGCTARKCRCGRDRQTQTDVREILALIKFVVAGNTGRSRRPAVARQMKRYGLLYTAKKLCEAHASKWNRKTRRLLAAAVPKPQRRLPKEFANWPEQSQSNDEVEVLDFAQLAALKERLSRAAFLDQLRTAG